MIIRRRSSSRIKPLYKGYEPFILTADTVLTAQTIMADDIKTTNMSRFPRRMTISRKQTGLIQASLRDYVNVVSGRRPSTSDPIQTLVDEYKAYVTGLSNGVVVDETEVYNAITADVAAGEVQSDGTNTKSVLRFGYKYGMVKSGAALSKLISLYKIGGSYVEFDVLQVGDNAASTAEWDTDKIVFKNGVIAIKAESTIDINYAKNSFYIELKTHRQFVGATTYNESCFATNTGFRHGTLVNQKLGLLTYSEAAVLASANSNDNYFIDEQATYKIEYNRAGDTLTPKLYRNGALWQTMADRTWDKVLNTKFYTGGASVANNKNEFREFKAALL